MSQMKIAAAKGLCAQEAMLIETTILLTADGLIASPKTQEGDWREEEIKDICQQLAEAHEEYKKLNASVKGEICALAQENSQDPFQLMRDDSDTQQDFTSHLKRVDSKLKLFLKRIPKEKTREMERLEVERKRAQEDGDRELARRRAEQELQLSRDKAEQELQLSRDKAEQELQLYETESAQNKAEFEMQRAQDKAEFEKELAQKWVEHEKELERQQADSQERLKQMECREHTQQLHERVRLFCATPPRADQTTVYPATPQTSGSSLTVSVQATSLVSDATLPDSKENSPSPASKDS